MGAGVVVVDANPKGLAGVLPNADVVVAEVEGLVPNAPVPNPVEEIPPVPNPVPVAGVADPNPIQQQMNSNNI